VTGANNSGFAGLVQLTSGILSVGSDNALGTGALTLNGGTIQSSAVVMIGNDFTIGGAVTVGGTSNLTFTGTGTATASNTLSVANTATTTFSGILSGLLAIAESAGRGNLVLSSANTYSGGTTLTSGTLTAGNDSALGTGALALNGGTLQSSMAVTLANTFTVGGLGSIGGSNALTLTGAGTLNSGASLIVTNSATTTLSGVLSGAGELDEMAATGMLILSAANTYTGATSITGGTLQLGVDNAVPSSSAVTVATGATFDLNNFNDSIGSLTDAGNVSLGSGSLNAGADNTSTTFSGILSGTGNVTKIGTGTWTLTGNNTYTGATTVMAGTLLVNGSQPGSNVMVASGATLGGSGTVGTITTAGTVSPGGSGTTGILQSGDTVFNAGSTFAVTLNGTTAGTGYDQLNVTGMVDLTASPTLTLTAGFSASTGDTFTILMSTAGIMGTFAGFANNSTITSGGQTFVVNYTNNAVTLTRTLTTTTTVVTSSANPSVFGQPITFTATVTPMAPATGTPTGLVTFEDGTVMLGTGILVNGVATFTTTTPLSLGGHSITAVYGGDNTFATSTSTPLTQTVNQASTTTTLSASSNPSGFGQMVTFTAIVTAVSPGAGIPTGTVTFSDGTTVLGTGTLNANGQATFQTSSLTLGTHSITAMYSGDTNFMASTSSVLAQAVLNASTTVVMSATNPSVFGQSVTFTATVTPTNGATGTPTGTVTFMEGNAALGNGTLINGVATFTSTTLGAGTHSITAIYSGDSNFASSASAPLAQTVDQASTTTTLTSSLNPSTSGQAVTFTATVSPIAPGAGTPTGTVTFMDGTTVLGTGTLSGGVATFQTTTLSVAAHQITAVYGGDTNFTGSTSTALTQTVNPSTSLTPSQKFVTQVYSDLLGRSPDPGGLTFWSSLIDNNQATHAQVALGIETSPEGRMDEVEALYEKLLGRQADPSGLSLAVGFLEAGGSYFQLEATLVGSPEYYQRAGGTNSGFLTSLYQDALGRAVDGTGQSLASQALANGTTNAMLADVVFTSQEGLQDLVQSLYSQYLHRSADSTGLSQSTAALQLRLQQQGQATKSTTGQQTEPAGSSVEQLISVLIGSDEYFGSV
jgi:autotransporter-associated beta strand protein